MISYAASTGNKGSPRHTETRRDTAERYIIDDYNPQGKTTGCADCAIVHGKTTLPPEIQDQEGGIGNPRAGCYRQPAWGMMLGHTPSRASGRSELRRYIGGGLVLVYN